MIKTVGVVKWGEHDALATAIGEELQHAGYLPVYFRWDHPPPLDAAFIFSFGPKKRWVQIPYALAQRPAAARPFLLHWNTENPPDLRLPWLLMGGLGAARGWVDRLHESGNPQARRWLQRPPLRQVDERFIKYRYIGDYYYAARAGWLPLYVETSELYAALHRRHGLDAMQVPWGTVPAWYKDLDLPRDIQVLWFGKRRTARRDHLLDRVRAELKTRGIEMYVADGIEHPFVHGEERTRFLNRTQIVLNLLPTYYDHAFPYRFHVAAANRALVITEPTLKHSSIYQPGVHFVSAPVEQLAETIALYLHDERARCEIVEHAYELVTTRLTMEQSVRAIMARAEAARADPARASS